MAEQQEDMKPTYFSLIRLSDITPAAKVESRDWQKWTKTSPRSFSFWVDEPFLHKSRRVFVVAKDKDAKEVKPLLFPHSRSLLNLQPFNRAL